MEEETIKDRINVMQAYLDGKDVCKGSACERHNV